MVKIGRTTRITLALLTAGGLIAPASALGFEISRARTEASGVTSAAGARHVQLRFAAELINGLPDLSEDVVVGWQEVGGIEPVPFRVLIPAGCFVLRRPGARVDDFRGCRVEMSVGSEARDVGSIVDFDARVVRRDDGTSRLDISTTFVPPDPIIPPDPIVPPDPVHPFLGLFGGAAVQIANGATTTAVPPLRSETVSGVEPTPF